MSLRAAQRRRHAEDLLAAATSRVAIPALTEEFPGQTTFGDPKPRFVTSGS